MSLEHEPNPYQAPQAPLATAGQLWANATVVELLRQTRPWVLLISIVGFIAAALAVVGGVIGAIVLLGQKNPAESVVAIVYLFIGLVYFFPSLYLLRYSQKIRDLAYSQNVADLEAALAAQRSFWRFCGIALALLLALYALIFVVAIGVGVFGLMR